MRTLLFVLASYGVVNIVTQGGLLRRFRGWIAERSEAAGHWIGCPMCLGFAVGVAWSLCGLEPGTGLAGVPGIAAAGAIASGACWILRVALHRLGEDDL